MTVGISHAEFVLVDNWPGVVTNGPNPDAWTTISATEDFPLGTKRAVYCSTNKGWATLMYLYYTTGAGTVAVATVGCLCGLDKTAVGTAGQNLHITNDGSDALLLGPIAVALGTMVNARYGWFWVGGVCPTGVIAALDDQLFMSDGSIAAAGDLMVLADSASICKFHLQTGTDIAGVSAYAFAVDTTS